MSNTLALLVSPGGVALSVSTGGVDFFYSPGSEDDGAVVVSHRKRKKFYTREGDNLNIYRHKEDAPVLAKPVKRGVKPAKRQDVAVATAEPEQTIPLAQIEALARQYDEQQAYRKALENRQYAMLAAMYERLLDEQDVELLLMYA
jgi:hypothetical protein